ncbi:TonB-dependent receptor [Ignatzschineria rhizosphaerae]|uniref:TonB-dependent receptor n=1 Tax=Ignatzschineria rhizosphaerae TaxID=2923279 RepID=A0ABY3X3E9_9GAMM|nr:TonB-dependent receptor [Ignatzschineria rhizosphaerae]UNM97407.1 TonB-dependent receptor [Ignatzschineria rhizosphaerae]
MSIKNRYRWQPLAFAITYLLSQSMLSAEEISELDEADVPQNTLNTLGLGQVVVKAQALEGKGHQEKHDEVYDRSISSVYRDKTEVERFKGAAPADVFKGMVGVNSGDARNSGALDPNIRGIQGQGRVPLTIDGTEQSITVWRGYSGANNRNYIDPMLIGGITIEKGPSLTRGINSSVGGAVAITTLGINDIVREDKDWGIDFKIEGSNNSVKPNMPDLNAPLPDILGSGSIPYMFSFYDNAVMVTPRKSGQNRFGDDKAIRLAAGKKWQDFDLLGVYVYRKKGNHFSGKNGANYYSGSEYNRENAAERKDYWDNYTRHLADIYKPGDEVPNTSNEMQSLLVKGTWRPNEDHIVELGLRHTWGKYGEIMPSRVANHLFDLDHMINTAPENPMKDYVRQQVIGKFPQWPLSKVKTTAIYLNHQWNPDNPYIDFEANIWGTRTILDTHTSGGYPRQFISSWTGDSEVKWHSTSATNSKNKRWGATISNKMELTEKLDLTLGGSYQYETLSSSDDWYLDPEQRKLSSFRAIPREGWRKEWRMSFSFDWQPLSWLELSAGASKNGYSSYDEQLNRQRRERQNSFGDIGKPGIRMSYQVEKTQEMIDAERAYKEEVDYIFKNYAFGSPEYRELSMQSMKKYQAAESKFIEENATSKGLTVSPQSFNGPYEKIYVGEVGWYVRDDGKYYREDNPYLNGYLAERGATQLPRNPDQYTALSQGTTGDRFAPVPKQSSSGGWQPVLAATAWLSDNARVYTRYAKTERMPSMFETTVGFSASPVYRGVGLKPEKGTNIEIGYLHDLSELLGADRYADFKIAYFYNEIKDVIDRDQAFSLRNIDKQKISGLELQSRYDNGRFFADFSASYFLKNEVCDESTAISQDPYHGRIKSCVKDGFYNSYLRNMTPPKYALNLTMGGRFFNEKLEVGTRILHHAGSKNTDKENFGDIAPWQTNVPIHWGKVTTLDAWVNYAIDKDMSMEVVATNLTNQYYLDPLTRSHFPAPGRTIRIGFNMKF